MGYETNASTEEMINSISQTIRETDFHVNEEGELCKLEKGELKPLCNFIFRPIEKIKRVDNQGIAKEYKYVFEGVLKGEKKLDRVEILISDIENHKWIKKNWDVFCEVYSNQRHNYSSIQDYIYQSARNIPEKIEYDTIGWHYFEKKWFFLHSEGIIGSIERNIGTTNTEFVFKRDLSLTPKDAFLESVNMLDICDHKLSL